MPEEKAAVGHGEAAELNRKPADTTNSQADRMMRLVLMGTGPFAVPSFDALIDAGHHCLKVFTRPEKGGNGKKTPEKSPVRKWAEGRCLEVVAPEFVNSQESLELLKSLSPDLLVVCDYGQILKRKTLSQARLGGINLHGSLLPAHRGAAPVQWSVLKGDEETGVSVIHMTPRLDAGPIIAIRKTPIGRKETAGELEQRLASLGVQATLEAVELLTTSANQNTAGELDLHGIVQDDSLASRAPRLSKADGRIDWHRKAKELDQHVRGMQPWPGAYTEVQVLGKQHHVRLAVLDLDPWTPDPAMAFPPARSPGLVHVVEQRLFVACGDGWVEIQSLKPAGKRQMSAAEWLRGRPLKDGVIMQ